MKLRQYCTKSKFQNSDVGPMISFHHNCKPGTIYDPVPTPPNLLPLSHPTSLWETKPEMILNSSLPLQNLNSPQGLFLVFSLCVLRVLTLADCYPPLGRGQEGIEGRGGRGKEGRAREGLETEERERNKERRGTFENPKALCSGWECGQASHVWWLSLVIYQTAQRSKEPYKTNIHHRWGYNIGL